MLNNCAVSGEFVGLRVTPCLIVFFIDSLAELESGAERNDSDIYRAGL